MTGRLYGIGLGPGDPELLTLKAARLIGAAEVVAYPALPGVESFARSIAAAHFGDGVLELRLDVPMVSDRAPAQAAYDRGAERIADCLSSERDVVFLCEGDPLFFGSFMYVAARLEAQFEVEVVPGVSSVMAAAAAARRPLVARDEMLSVVPGTLVADEMRARIEAADSVAILKVGRHLGKIRGVLDALGLIDQAVYVERATLEAERVMPLEALSGDAPYFSMILVTKGRDPWL